MKKIIGMLAVCMSLTSLAYADRAPSSVPGDYPNYPGHDQSMKPHAKHPHHVTVRCRDGARRPASKNACKHHGGISHH